MCTMWALIYVNDLCGVDSLYHAQTNVSVKRDFFEGNSIWNIYKGGVLFFSNVYIQKDRCTKWEP